MFESGYTRELIELGYRDAMEARSQLMAFMSGEKVPPVPWQHAGVRGVAAPSVVQAREARRRAGTAQMGLAAAARSAVGGRRRETWESCEAGSDRVAP